MDDQHMCYNQGPQQVDKTLQQDVTPSLVKMWTRNAQSNTHFVPKSYFRILKNALEGIDHTPKRPYKLPPRNLT